MIDEIRSRSVTRTEFEHHYHREVMSGKIRPGAALAWYKSSNTKVATVSKTGVIKGIKAGTATITATLYNNTTKITLKVKIVAKEK